MPEPDPNRTLAFETPEALRAWLRANHATEPELWVMLYKKASGRRSITWDDVVIESLCWGWIDGIKKSHDAHAYLQRITPRKQRSQWSQRNCDHAERLIAQKRMQAPGLIQVEAAKADGRWDNAYAPQSEMSFPEEFLTVLKSRPEAQAFFDSLNKSNRYAIAYRLTTAKKPETLVRRQQQILAMLERGETFH